MTPSDPVTSWLLTDADPSVRALVLRELLDRPNDDPELREAEAAIGQRGWAAKILYDQHPLGHWETFRGVGDEFDDLYLPKYISSNWRAIVLAELGATRADPRIARAADLFLRYWSGPKGGFGGTTSELCVTGNVARMLLRFGYADDPNVRAALDWLVAAQKDDGGWHCFPSPTGTIDGWEALAAFAELPKPGRSAAIDRAVARGVDFYLSHGLLTESDGSSYAPWTRLHYPNHYYYDLLVGVDLVTRLGYGADRRLRPALDRLLAQRTAEGRWLLDAAQPDLEPDDPYHPNGPVYPFLLEAVGVPSRWITARALVALRRAERAG